MIKEIIFGAASVTVIAAACAVIKEQMLKTANGEDVEQIFVDELNIGEIKKWFVGKLETENQKGIVFYPTKENTEKWKIKISENKNQLVQIVYDMKNDKVCAYREITFTELSEKLKELLDSNGGTIVIDK